jgi:hypothetical protein
VLHTIAETLENADDEEANDKNSDLAESTASFQRQVNNGTPTPPNALLNQLDSISTISSAVSSLTSRSTASILNSSNGSIREIREADSNNMNSEKDSNKTEATSMSSSPKMPADKENDSRLKAFLKHRLSGPKLKIGGFVKSLLKLLTNFRYVLLIVILSFECIIISIFTHYMILYSQHVYKISNSRSSIMVGGIIVPAAIVGAIFGGLVVNKMKLFIGGCTRLILISSIVVVTGIFVLIFIRCENPPSSGIDLATQRLP